MIEQPETRLCRSGTFVVAYRVTGEDNPVGFAALTSCAEAAS